MSAPSSVTLNNDAASLRTFAYTPWLGISSYSGPNGASGSFGYDDYGQTRTAVLTPGGTVYIVHYPGQTTTLGMTSPYPPSYFPTSQNGFPWAEMSYIGSHYTRKSLDGLGRVVREEKGPTGLNGIFAATSIVDTQYGPCACSPTGKMTRVSQPYAPGGTINWTTYTYDGMGRTLTVTGPDGSSQSKMTYNAQASGVPVEPPSVGNSTTSVDPKGNWRIVTTDVFGNVSQVIEPNPQNGAQPFFTSYAYNKMDQLSLLSRD